LVCFVLLISAQQPMSEFTIASFNVKNLISANQEYYRFEKYTDEEYAWKSQWTVNQLLTMSADVVCFQEIFDEKALLEVIAQTNEEGREQNDQVVPDKSKRYHRKAIFKKLAFDAYPKDSVFFAKNIHDGKPGKRRPGLAIASRFGFEGTPEVIQQLDKPLEIQFPKLRSYKGESEELAGAYRLESLSRPIIKASINVGGTSVTVFNCHLKSKLGEYIVDNGSDFPAEADLVDYSPVERAIGEARAMMRRTAEALVLREAVVKELKKGNPVMVLGDFNDGESSVSTAVIRGERPFKNYAWMRRHDAKNQHQRYSEQEDTIIRDQINKYQLVSAETLFIKKSQRDMLFTSAFGGVYESIDQILFSQHFNAENADSLGEMEYFSVFNDHLTDGAHPEAPYNKLASDHGQIMAHMSFKV